MSKRRINVLLPEKLKTDFFDELQKAGFGIRKKSSFFEEYGLQKLLLLDDTLILKRLVNDGIGAKANNKSDVFSVTDESALALDGVIIRLRQLDPYMEINLSTLIRAALIYIVRT